MCVYIPYTPTSNGSYWDRKGFQKKPDMRVWHWIFRTYFTNMWETVAKVRRLGEGGPNL